MARGWICILGGVAALSASHATAAEWWLIFTGGEKPSRVFVAVDEAFLDPVPFAENTYKLETLTYLENPKSPDWVTSNMIIDCTNRTLEEKLIQVSPRGGKLTTAPDQPPHPARNVVGEQMIKFACEMGPKAAAARTAERKVDKSDIGWLYLGNITLGDVGDLAWNSMWSDGTRPAGTPRSQAELDREMAALGTRREKALAEANAIATATVEADKRDQKLTADTQELTVRANKRRKRELAPVLAGLSPWLGRPETELVSSWGQPTGFEERGDRRFLHYTRSVEIEVPAPSQGGCQPGYMPAPPGSNIVGCVPMGGLYGAPGPTRETVTCTASFEFRGDMLIDFVTKSHSGFGACSTVFGKR